MSLGMIGLDLQRFAKRDNGFVDLSLVKQDISHVDMECCVACFDLSRIKYELGVSANTSPPQPFPFS